MIRGIPLKAYLEKTFKDEEESYKDALKVKTIQQFVTFVKKRKKITGNDSVELVALLSVIKNSKNKE